MNPLRTIYKVAIIAGVSLIVGMVLPGMIAHHGGVFYQETMDAKFGYLKTDAQIHLIPFFGNPLMYSWIAMYTVLGLLVFLLPPWLKRSEHSWGRLRTTVALAGGIYVVWEWTVWTRNFVLRNEGRRVYAFANFDIYPPSFFIQEINVVLFAVLLAILWQQWSAFYLQRRQELTMIEDSMSDAALDYRNIERLSKTYLHWQIASIILALGFIPFSGAYWNLVARRNDSRYLLASVTIHVLWAITWILISLPLLITWYNWRATGTRALSELATKPPADETVGVRIKVLTEIRPIGFWNVATSGVVAFISFCLPILQAFFRRP